MRRQAPPKRGTDASTLGNVAEVSCLVTSVEGVSAPLQGNGIGQALSFGARRLNRSLKIRQALAEGECCRRCPNDGRSFGGQQGALDWIAISSSRPRKTRGETDSVTDSESVDDGVSSVWLIDHLLLVLNPSKHDARSQRRKRSVCSKVDTCAFVGVLV